MTRMKRVVVVLPEDVLEDLDLLAAGTCGRRSEIIREACIRYLDELKRIKLREQMKLGYQEMAELNVFLAEEMTRLAADEVASAGSGGSDLPEREGNAGGGDDQGR